jgi:hypothetical protein
LTATWRRPYENASVAQAVGWLVLGSVTTAYLVWFFAGSWRWWYLLVPVATVVLVRLTLVGLLVSEHGVRLVSFWRTRTVAWPDVAGVTVAASGILDADTIWIETRSGHNIRAPMLRGKWYTVPWGTVARPGHRVADTRRFSAILRLLRERASG